MDTNVVKLRGGEPLITDIPGRLRFLADRIERGEQGEVEFVTLCLQGEEFRPAIFVLGDAQDRHQLAGMFMHCAQRMLDEPVK